MKKIVMAALLTAVSTSALATDKVFVKDMSIKNGSELSINFMFSYPSQIEYITFSLTGYDRNGRITTAKVTRNKNPGITYARHYMPGSSEGVINAKWANLWSTQTTECAVIESAEVILKSGEVIDIKESDILGSDAYCVR